MKSQIYLFFFFSLILAHCQHLSGKESERFEWDDRKAHKLNRSHIWPTLKTIYAWPEPNIKAKSPETFLWLFGFVATSLNPRKLHFSRARNINNLWHTLKHQRVLSQLISSISIRQRGRQRQWERRGKNVSKWKKMKRFKFQRQKENRRKKKRKTWKENTNKYSKLSLSLSHCQGYTDSKKINKLFQEIILYAISSIKCWKTLYNNVMTFWFFCQLACNPGTAWLQQPLQSNIRPGLSASPCPTYCFPLRVHHFDDVVVVVVGSSSLLCRGCGLPFDFQHQELPLSNTLAKDCRHCWISTRYDTILCLMFLCHTL